MVLARSVDAVTRRQLIGWLVLRRLAWAVPLIALISLLVFALASASPFDPIDSYLGDQGDRLTDAQRDQLRSTLGVDQSWLSAWWSWLGGLVHADLGFSRTYHEPVSAVLAQRLPPTLLLGTLGAIIAITTAFTLGFFIGLRPGSVIDRTVSTMAVLLQSVPPFIVALGSVLIFAVGLRWFPSSGISDPGAPVNLSSALSHVVLPSIVLGVSQLPWLTLALRQTVSTTVQGETGRWARARGLPKRVVAFGHVLPCSIAPFLSVCGARLPELLVGATIVETVFGWPGLGNATVEAAKSVDFSLLAILTVIITAFVLVGNLVADTLGALIDPRIDTDG